MENPPCGKLDDRKSSDWKNPHGKSAWKIYVMMEKSAENLRDVENPMEKSIAKSKISAENLQAENLHGKSCGKIGGTFCGKYNAWELYENSVEK